MEFPANNSSHYLEYYPEIDTEPKDQFVESLSNIRSKQVHRLSVENLLNGLNHDGESTTEVELPHENGLYLEPTLYDDLESRGQLPQTATFQSNELHSLGREDSRHKVFFGNLSLIDYTSGVNHTMTVAVKPFNLSETDTTSLGIHEYAMYEYLTQAGLETPQPLGLLYEDNQLYVLSEFVPEVITLDSLDWPKLDDETIRNVIERGLESLLMLHKIGIFHGDAGFKNLTLQPNINQHWIVDLEMALSIKNSATTTPEKDIIQLVINDLADVIWSLHQYGVIQEGTSASEAFQTQYEKVLLPYRQLVCSSKEDTEILKIIRSELGTIDRYFYHYAMPDES